MENFEKIYSQVLEQYKEPLAQVEGEWKQHKNKNLKKIAIIFGVLGVLDIMAFGIESLPLYLAWFLLFLMLITAAKSIFQTIKRRRNPSFKTKEDNYRKFFLDIIASSVTRELYGMNFIRDKEFDFNAWNYSETRDKTKNFSQHFKLYGCMSDNSRDSVSIIKEHIVYMHEIYPSIYYNLFAVLEVQNFKNVYAVINQSEVCKSNINLTAAIKELSSFNRSISITIKGGYMFVYLRMCKDLDFDAITLESNFENLYKNMNIIMEVKKILLNHIR